MGITVIELEYSLGHLLVVKSKQMKSCCRPHTVSPSEEDIR